jgi:Ran GTPase-activating protein (RanGAP) involved in mRNA processing and transport
VFSWGGVWLPVVRRRRHILRNPQTTEWCTLTGTKAIATSLERNFNLKHLDLGYNNIGQKGALLLAPVLYHNRTLETMILDGNRLGTEGGRALIHTQMQVSKAFPERSMSLLHCDLTFEEVHMNLIRGLCYINTWPMLDLTFEEVRYSCRRNTDTHNTLPPV